MLKRCDFQILRREPVRSNIFIASQRPSHHACSIFTTLRYKLRLFDNIAIIFCILVTNFAFDNFGSGIGESLCNMNQGVKPIMNVSYLICNGFPSFCITTLYLPYKNLLILHK